MKHYYTLLLGILIAISAHAQLHTINPGDVKVNPVHITGPKQIANDSRDVQLPILLNYGGIDERYASDMGQIHTVYSWPLDRRFPADSSFTLRTCAANFDTLLFSNELGENYTYPLSATQLTLDSVSFAFANEHNTGAPDTFIITVLKGSTFGITGSGTTGDIAGQVLWADTMLLDTSYGITTFSTMVKYPGLSLPRGEWFAVKLDFMSSNLANKFFVAGSFRDDCNNTCMAKTSIAGENSYAYVNWLNQGNNLSGINNLVTDCNGNGISEDAACELFYIQNLFIWPYVTADVEFTVSLANTFAFCQGANTLQTSVAAAEGPVTYSWSPSTGLSSDTAASPIVAVPINPILYTVTATDGINTSTASVLVTADQSTCPAVDTLAGLLYFDFNSNQQHDTAEPVIPNATIQVNNYYILTDSTGHYQFVLLHATGNYTVSAKDYYGFATHTEPVSGLYTGTLAGSLFNLDFGIKASPDSVNAYVTLGNPGIPARPGFPSNIYARYYNQSPYQFTGVLKVIYDSIQTYVDASPAPDNIDLVNRTLSWNVSLEGVTHGICRVGLYTPPANTFGKVLSHQAIIIPDNSFSDIDSTDNVWVYEETVVGSYDPNDKAVSPVGKGPGGRILPGQDFNYTIRFQNTGTFYAENVAVQDTIDTNLDISTLKVLSASHKYTYTIEGRLITWHFNQIMLPDSNADEPNSHGYINYSIGMNDNVTDLSQISNTAYIYFDYNEAIITNTTVNTVDYNLNAVGIADISGSTSVRVFPNPFKGETNFVLGAECTDASLKVFNVNGQLVDETDNLSEGIYTYNAKKLATGMYGYLIMNSTGILAKGKLIVE